MRSGEELTARFDLPSAKSFATTFCRNCGSPLPHHTRGGRTTWSSDFMIDLHTYLLYIGAVVVLVIVPGPDMAYMLARTIAQGQKAGVLAAVGINVGAYVHVAAAILGLSAVLAASSMAFTAVKWLGACYLIWIGIQAITSKSGPLSIGAGASEKLDGRAIFWQGFL